MPIFIYGLVDPETRGVRYVGKSIRPFERLTSHMNEPPGCHRTHWLRELRSRGLKPTMIVLQVFADGEAWQESERFWIAEGKRRGWNLTNNTIGGDGVPGLSPEARARISAASSSRRYGPEVRAKIGAASRGRRASPERKARMRALMTGRTFTPDWIAKIRDGLRKLTDEDIAAIQYRIEIGELSCDLAKEYGVHRTTIQKVKAGTYSTAAPERSEMPTKDGALIVTYHDRPTLEGAENPIVVEADVVLHPYAEGTETPGVLRYGVIVLRSPWGDPRRVPSMTLDLRWRDPRLEAKRRDAADAEIKTALDVLARHGVAVGVAGGAPDFTPGPQVVDGASP